MKLSSNSTRLLSGVSPLCSSIGCFAYNNNSLSTRGASSEALFEFMWIATYFSSLRTRVILAPLHMPKRVWPSMNQSRIFFVQPSTLTPRMHRKPTDTWKVLYAKQPNSWPKVMLSYKTTLNMIPISSARWILPVDLYKLCFGDSHEHTCILHMSFQV